MADNRAAMQNLRPSVAATRWSPRRRRNAVLGSALLFGGAMLLGLAGLIAGGAWRPTFGTCHHHGAPHDAYLAVTARTDVGTVQRRQLAVCDERRLLRDWSGLFDCAMVVDHLGLVAQARELRGVALAETRSSLHADRLRALVRDGDLRGGEQELAQIPAESAYAPAMRALLAYVAPAMAPASCGAAGADDRMAQAASQYQRGYASAALLVAISALACRQDTQTYRIVALYACAAHDAAVARQYFDKIPAAYQAAIEQTCQLEHVSLDQVERP